MTTAEYPRVVVLHCGCELGPDGDVLCDTGRELWNHYIEDLCRWDNTALDSVTREPRTYRLSSAALDLHWEVIS